MAFVPAAPAASLETRLNAFPFVRDLEKGARDHLLQITRAKHFAEDTRIVRYGDDCPLVPLVERGVIRVTQSDAKELLLYDVAPGEACVLALTSALRTSRYPAEAMAAAGTDALLVPADALRRLFGTDSSMQRFVIETFTHRVTDLMDLAKEVVFEPLPTRLAKLLERESRAQGGDVRLTHAELAAMLGSAREVVSRALDAMQHQGVVTLGRRRIAIVDIAALAQWTS